MINKVNLVLSGGGIKGIAFSGVVNAGEIRGFKWGNIAGVSAGALAGSFLGSGYTSGELQRILYDFDFSSMGKIEKSPAVSKYSEINNTLEMRSTESIRDFLFYEDDASINIDEGSSNNLERGLFKNLIKYSKEGCIYDGDYLEEWVYKTLKTKGVRTFADLRGGITDKLNTRGYKVRMTAVDANRRKTIILPDDIAFYGIDPDKLEVAKAVRMSTSVPFAFKPVEIKKQEGSATSIHYFIDGGVVDNFPSWLIDGNFNIPKVGFNLSEKIKKKRFVLNTPLNILKSMIYISHDLSKTNKKNKMDFIGQIDTHKVKFLDFDLSENEKEYLYLQGKKTGLIIFEAVKKRYSSPFANLRMLFNKRFGI